MEEIHIPKSGDTVNIVLRDRDFTAEVVRVSNEITSIEGYPAVVVEVDGNLNTFWHKSHSGMPYWKWPE